MCNYIKPICCRYVLKIWYLYKKLWPMVVYWHCQEAFPIVLHKDVRNFLLHVTVLTLSVFRHDLLLILCLFSLNSELLYIILGDRPNFSLKVSFHSFSFELSFVKEEVWSCYTSLRVRSRIGFIQSFSCRMWHIHASGQ